jgi:hypothetical protein
MHFAYVQTLRIAEHTTHTYSTAHCTLHKLYSLTLHTQGQSGFDLDAVDDLGLMKEGDEEAAALALAAAQQAAAAAADEEGQDDEARSAAVAAAAASSKPAAIMLRLLRKRLDKGGGSATYGSIAKDTKRGDKRRRNVAAGFFQLLQVCVLQLFNTAKHIR